MKFNARSAFVKVVLLGLFFIATANVWAGEGDIESMLNIVEKRQNNDKSRQEAIKAGEERTVLCQHCHGRYGNSLRPDVPNLAGQNAKYLLEQIEKFATRQRNDFVMSELAANFTTEDKVNIAIFYHSKPVKPQSVDEQKATNGKALYHRVCSSCHGIEGYGNQKLARLAGQKPVYVMNVLKTFRINANDPAAGKESERKSKLMEGIVKNLSDEEIESVAEYIASMR